MSTHLSHTGQKKTYDAVALLVLAVLFIGLMIIVTFLFRGARLDLTENKLYTLAPGTKHVLGTLEEPINLYFFFSQQPSRNNPQLRAYAQHVHEMLEEMAQRSNGKLHLSVIDPQPFSDDEDRAAQFGVEAVPVGAYGEPVYFGLAGTNSTEGRQVIPSFLDDQRQQTDQSKQQFLEYEIASMVYRLAHPKQPVIGLLSSLPMDQAFDPQTGGMREGWEMLTQLRQLYTIRTVAPDFKAIDKDIDVLMVVHPKNLAPTALYAIDQYVMRGGKLMAFVDPRSEADPAAMGGPEGGGAMSDLNPLLKAWGVEYDPSKAIGDRTFGALVPRQGQSPIQHLAALDLKQSAMNAEDVVTAKLQRVIVQSVGALRPVKDAKTQFEPLLTSSTQAAPIDTGKLMFLRGPETWTTLEDGFAPTGEKYAFAARVHGKLPSAFPNGSPDGGTNNHLKESSDDGDVIIVADTDLLADRMWVQVQNVFGRRFPSAYAHNYDFVANALDNLTGSADLISVRGRQSFTRPFTRVNDLRQRADQELRAKEQELNRQLQDTERKLTQLQATRADQGSMTLTQEQQQEVQRFQDERLRVRKELRNVRRGLDVGIESLGAVIKFINICAIPLVLSILAIVVAVRRRRRLLDSRAATGVTA